MVTEKVVGRMGVVVQHVAPLLAVLASDIRVLLGVLVRLLAIQLPANAVGKAG